VVGPIERRIGVDEAFWAARGTLAFAQGEYRVYRIQGL